MSQNKRSMAPSARTSFFDLVACIVDASCNIVFLLLRSEYEWGSNALTRACSQSQFLLLLLVFRSNEPQLHDRDCVCLLDRYCLGQARDMSSDDFGRRFQRPPL